MFGDSVTIDVEAGHRRLRANNTLVWKTVECDVQAGQHARYTIINRPGFLSFAMLSLLGGGPIYLSFEREPDSSEPAASPIRG